MSNLPFAKFIKFKYLGHNVVMRQDDGKWNATIDGEPLGWSEGWSAERLGLIDGSTPAVARCNVESMIDLEVAENKF